MPHLPLPLLPTARLATASLATMLALAACRSAPPPVHFDPNPVTKYRWRGELAPVDNSVDAGSAVAPAASPTSATTSNAVRTASNGRVERPRAPVMTASVAGSAVVQPGIHDGETVAFVTLRGAAPGSWWRWRVVEGDCAGGATAGSAAAYAPLQASADGFAEGIATLAVPSPRSARWAVQVLRADGATPVACAPLRLSR